MYALQDLRSFHSLLIAAGLISIIGGRFEDRSPRGTGSSLDSIVLVGYSSHRDGRSFVRWTFEHGDGDTDGGCARFIKGWGEKRSMPLTNWMRGICGGCGYFSYRRDLILLTLMDSGQNSFALDARVSVRSSIAFSTKSFPFRLSRDRPEIQINGGE